MDQVLLGKETKLGVAEKRGDSRASDAGVGNVGRGGKAAARNGTCVPACVPVGVCVYLYLCVPMCPCGGVSVCLCARVPGPMRVVPVCPCVCVCARVPV